MKLQMPDYVKKAILCLEHHGFEAYAVGGCVRDSLAGRTPHDWDLCTSAQPAQVIDCFAERPIVKTGMRHGTILVVFDGMPLEITTYRIDGEYSDCRRPDQVRFTKKIEEDLRRRDFTINAMAYHPHLGLIDPFGGQQDLNLRLVRCVGEPHKRFEEDALRILRGLRFASQLGFLIHPETRQAMLDTRERLKQISLERILMEWNGILQGNYLSKVLIENTSIIEVFLPELRPLLSKEQRRYWMSTIFAMSIVPNALHLRWALLLYGISEYGAGYKAALQALNRLRLERREAKATELLLVEARVPLEPDSVSLKRRLYQMGGMEPVRALLVLQKALARAFPNFNTDEEKLKQVQRILEQIQESGQCFSLRTLAVNGRDLQELGYAEGPAVGICLHQLLQLVIEGTLENRKDVLLEYAKDHM